MRIRPPKNCHVTHLAAQGGGYTCPGGGGGVPRDWSQSDPVACGCAIFTARSVGCQHVRGRLHLSRELRMAFGTMLNKGGMCKKCNAEKKMQPTKTHTFCSRGLTNSPDFVQFGRKFKNDQKICQNWPILVISSSEFKIFPPLQNAKILPKKKRKKIHFNTKKCKNTTHGKIKI